MSRRDAGLVRTVRGREVARVAGFAGEMDAAVDRFGQHRALAGLTDPGVAVAAADKGCVAPARCGERGETAAPVAAEKRNEFVDRERGGIAILQCLGTVAAEKALDDRPAIGREAVAGGAGAVRVADQMRVGRSFGTVDVKEDLVGKTQRQRVGGGVLVGERRVEPDL